jgi:hypothetical protein
MVLALSPALVGSLLVHRVFPPDAAHPGGAPSAALLGSVLSLCLLLVNLRRVPLQSLLRIGIAVLAAAAAMVPPVLLHGPARTGGWGDAATAWLIASVVLAAPLALLLLVVDGSNRALLRRTRDSMPARLVVQLGIALGAWWLGIGQWASDAEHVVPTLLAGLLAALCTAGAVAALADRRRRRVFLDEVASGNVLGLRLEAASEGALLVRIAPSAGYREAAADDEVIGTVDDAMRGLSSDNR